MTLKSILNVNIPPQQSRACVHSFPATILWLLLGILSKNDLEQMSILPMSKKTRKNTGTIFMSILEV